MFLSLCWSLIRFCLFRFLFFFGLIGSFNSEWIVYLCMLYEVLLVVVVIVYEC